MSLKKVLAIGVMGLAMAACDRNADGVLLPQEQIGAVRYVHASPDTRALDFRVVDIPSNAGMFGAAFRTTLPFHTALRAGNRSFRFFVSHSHIDTAQIRMADFQHNIAEGTKYTVYFTGRSTGGSQAETFITEDNAPDPGAGNFTIRITHVGAGMPNVDAFVLGGTAPQQIASNVAYKNASTFTNVPTGTGRTLEIRQAGTTTVLVSIAIPAGSAATATGQTAIPGSSQAGSGLTAILFPASVSGTLAAQFASPGVVFVYDRRP